MDIVNVGYPGECNIQLIMCEDRFLEVEANVLQRLALELVDSCGEGRLNWKLNTTELEWQIEVQGDKGDARMKISFPPCASVMMVAPKMKRESI